MSFAGVVYWGRFLRSFAEVVRRGLLLGSFAGTLVEIIGCNSMMRSFGGVV